MFGIKHSKTLNAKGHRVAKQINRVQNLRIEISKWRDKQVR